MCLAVPMRLERCAGRVGVASLDGVTRELRLDLVEAREGDWVLVHAGYAIQVLDEAAAAETWALLRELESGDGPADPAVP
jgi:hydrogenase expression/formation protein HypC